MDIAVNAKNTVQYSRKEDIPNETTLAALKESEDALKHPEKYVWYDDIDKMFEELLA